jgi:hypothetical protein
LILQSFIDESGSKNQDSFFHFAGFLASAEDWALFSSKWQSCLERNPSIECFKMREAANNPSGCFKNWRRKDVQKKVCELVAIIKDHAKLAIHCATDLSCFDELIGSCEAFPRHLRKPFTWTFSAAIAGVGYEAIELKAESVELFFDQHDKYAPIVRRAYPFLRQMCDPELSRILPEDIWFRDDCKFLPLQAADLLAWLFRKAFNGERNEWEWIAEELMPTIPMAEHSSIFTCERMERIIKLSKEIPVDLVKFEEWRRTWYEGL